MHGRCKPMMHGLQPPRLVALAAAWQDAGHTAHPMTTSLLAKNPGTCTRGPEWTGSADPADDPHHQRARLRAGLDLPHGAAGHHGALVHTASRG